MIRLLAITPPAAVAPIIDPELVDAWVRAGLVERGLAVLLREPGLELDATLAAQRSWPLRRALSKYPVPVLVSVDPRRTSPSETTRQLARARWPIAGVQLRGDPERETCTRWREHLGPNVIIGRSVHGLSPDDAEGLDYTCLAPIHAPRTGTGSGKHPIGVDGLRAWTRSRDDILALGGITAHSAAACLAAGARGVAGIRLFFGRSAEDRQDVQALRQLLAGADAHDHGHGHAQAKGRGRG